MAGLVEDNMSEGVTILSKQTSAGQQVEVKVGKYGSGYSALGYLDGRWVAAGDPKPMRHSLGVATHYIPANGGKGNALGLTAAEAALVADAIRDAAQADPYERMRQLIRERELMVENWMAEQDETDAARDETLDRAGAEAAIVARATGFVREAEARARLREWDAVHPEVIAELRARRQLDGKRWMGD